jgi:hypothetical protein
MLSKAEMARVGNLQGQALADSSGSLEGSHRIKASVCKGVENHATGCPRRKRVMDVRKVLIKRDHR